MTIRKAIQKQYERQYKGQYERQYDNKKDNTKGNTKNNTNYNTNGNTKDNKKDNTTIRKTIRKTNGNTKKNKLGYVAGPVIQANGRLTFEDELRSEGLLCFISMNTSVCTELANSMVTPGEPGADKNDSLWTSLPISFGL